MRDRLLKQALRERFMVTLKSGQAFDGLLDEQDALHLVFVDANAHVDGNHPASVAGELYLARANVAYMQKLPR